MSNDNLQDSLSITINEEQTNPFSFKNFLNLVNDENQELSAFQSDNENVYSEKNLNLKKEGNCESIKTS
jgi:hypothetical protein